MKERDFPGPPRSHRRADYVLNCSELASRETAHRIGDTGGRQARPIGAIAGVSKTFPPAAVREAASAGVRDFGENYVQEGVEKIRELSSLGLTWHYIGPIQSNKTRAIAEHFDWCTRSIAKNRRAARAGARPGQSELQVCIQVNVSARRPRARGSGAICAAREAVAALPRLKLRA